MNREEKIEIRSKKIKDILDRPKSRYGIEVVDNMKLVGRVNYSILSKKEKKIKSI